jgi:hypothetical protein
MRLALTVAGLLIATPVLATTLPSDLARRASQDPARCRFKCESEYRRCARQPECRKAAPCLESCRKPHEDCLKACQATPPD